ncbi:hypothetical protein ACFLY9_01530 [Patescibacteria group bacterium]
MASKLEESTQTAKKIGIGCLVVVGIVILYGIASSIFRPEPEPYNPYPQAANKELGELPVLEFEPLPLAEGSNPEYKIETTDGKLPKLPTIVNVHSTKTPRQSLTAQDDAVEIAHSLGFNSEPIVVSPTELKWTNGARTLQIDKLYKIVNLTTNYSKDEEASKYHEILPDGGPYIQTAMSNLTNAGLLPADYGDNPATNVTYMKLNSNFTLEKAKSASDAGFVRIDFFKSIESVGVTVPEGISEEQQDEILDMRIFSEVLTDSPHEGLIYIILGGKGGSQNIYEVQYIDWELDTKSTYDLISLKDAWSSVKNGEGYIRSLYETNYNPFIKYLPLNVQSFLLTNVETVYYSSKEYLKYIQPMYKFTGIATLPDDQRADYTIYYPAVKH